MSVIPYGNSSNITSIEQCFALEDPFDQVLCESQRLNITDPPSVYGFNNFTEVYTDFACLLLNATLQDRAKLPDTAYYCTVPLRGYDAFLFVSLALIATCFLFGKLSTVFILITGAIIGIINYYANLGSISNAIALWLNIKPAELFLYAFLPPLLVEQAVRIDFYMFKKTFWMAIMLAVVMVILTTVILTPLILFVLGFNNLGWNWVYGALFSAIIAPTDALAVSAILKKANGPVLLTSLLEGESLLNDATGITLFQVFLSIINDNIGEPVPTVWSVIPTIIVDIIRLSAIGFGIGIGFSMISYYILKWLRWRGAGSHIEATYILAMAYLVYYVTDAPANGSGVIAVVTFGLFGNATFLWGMTGSAFKTGDFEAIWDMISFAANGLVFFWAGVASMSFLIQASTEISKPAIVYVSIFLIYLFMLIIRTGCIALFNPIFRLVHKALSVAEIAFIGWSGLRGAVSLILLSSLSLAPAFIEEIENGESLIDVGSDVTLWTSFFIVFTLIINGPLIAPLLKSFGLTKTSDAAMKIREKAKCKILEYTSSCIKKYKDDDSGVFLLGADWYIVAKYVDLSVDLRKFGSSRHSLSPGKDDEIKTNFDANSLFSVSKAFLLTLWQKTRSSVLQVFNVKALCSRGASNPSEVLRDLSPSRKSTHIEEGKDEETSEESANFVNECHFQTIDRTLSRVEIISDNESTKSGDIEQGMQDLSGTDHETNEIQGTSSELLSEESEDINQVCLTGKAGQKLLQELQTAICTRECQHEMTGNKGDLYYSSLPAKSGAKLQSELRKNVQQHRDPVNLFQERLQSVDREVATSAHPTFKDLAQFFSNDSEIAIYESPFEQVEQKHSLLGSHTVNATTGKYLQHELMKQKSNSHVSHGMEARQRDLFGNKIQKNFDDALSISQSHSSTENLVSGYLAKKSNLHMLKKEARLLNSSRISDRQQSEPFSCKSIVQRRETNEGSIEANLKEIRSRLISGLKRRFMNRRAEGKISLETYQVLDQACREEMSTDGKIKLWSNLEAKSQGSLVTRGISKLGFKMTQRYKKCPRWAKWLLHYPHSWTSRAIREYLGTALLVSCEVAIEYTMALAISQHVKWLRLHDEYFSVLLDEVQEEADKSYNFVIDREIEAPDTFRAIQSYRAAVIVLKDMQEYVTTLLEVGVMEGAEADTVLHYINKKLRKLELTGPVWRPPKLKEIMKSLKPFSELTPDSTNWIWDLGLVQEYKPGEVIFKDDENEGTKQGIFHILNGVANKQVCSSSGGVVHEEYCGYGSCFGASKSLSMSSIHGTEIIIATGNALGRGTTVFHVTQNDVDKIWSLAMSGSSDMMDLVIGWTRMAALNVLDNVQDDITSLIEICLHKTIQQARAQGKVQSQLQTVSEEVPSIAKQSDLPPSLDDILSTDDFGIELNLDESTQKKIVEQRSKSISKEIYTRIRRTLFNAELKHAGLDDIICQTSSIILLKGTLENTIKSTKYPKRQVVAPAVLPHLNESEELSLINGISQGDTHSPLDIFWKVSSETATLLVCPKDDKIE